MRIVESLCTWEKAKKSVSPVSAWAVRVNGRLIAEDIPSDVRSLELPPIEVDGVIVVEVAAIYEGRWSRWGREEFEIRVVRK